MLHYVDEGAGVPILVIHGTPTWSFLYRDLIRELSDTYRVIALDHLGFGLSEKPPNGPYRPKDHARRLAEFIAHMELESFTMAVHDFGGPIGLPYAIEHPEQVDRLVLFNTWLWSLEDERTIRIVHRLARGVIGRLFYLRLNGSPRFLLKAAWGDTATLSREVHRHYLNPFQASHERTAPWVLVRELLGSSAWYQSWWERRESIVETPALMLWGLADPAFGESVLERWERTMVNGSVIRLPDVGHFVPDEASTRVVAEVDSFLQE